MSNKDSLIKALAVFDELDSESVVKGIAPLVNTVVGTFLLRRAGSRLLGRKVTLGESWAAVSATGWLAYFAARNWEQGVIATRDLKEVTKSGFAKKKKVGPDISGEAVKAAEEVISGIFGKSATGKTSRPSGNRPTYFDV